MLRQNLPLWKFRAIAKNQDHPIGLNCQTEYGIYVQKLTVKIISINRFCIFTTTTFIYCLGNNGGPNAKISDLIV